MEREKEEKVGLGRLVGVTMNYLKMMDLLVNGSLTSKAQDSFSGNHSDIVHSHISITSFNFFAFSSNLRKKMNF